MIENHSPKKILLDNLKKKFTEQNGFAGFSIGEITNYLQVELPENRLVETAIDLRDNHGFNQCADIVGVDRFTEKERFECLYNLYNISMKTRIFLKVKLDSENPSVDSVVSVWAGANWMEREVYDMFGIQFRNHPDLRRMYMLQDYEYYPLRKDYPLMGFPGASELPLK